MTKTIPWNTGGGSITLTYNDSEGNQAVTLSSSKNTGAARSQVLTIKAGDASKTLTVNQAKGTVQTGSMTALASAYSNTTNYATNSSYPIRNAYTNSSSTSYCQLTCNQKDAQHSINFDGFDFSSIPSDATITSVTIKFKGMVSSTTYITAATVQAYSGSTAKGSATNYRTTSATTYTLTSGTWTREELDGLSIHVTATRGNRNNTCYSRIYGMEVNVSYEY